MAGTGRAPRLFGILATDAPVVAVVRRGPSDWCRLGRWDLATPAYEPGAWLHGLISPQKSDLSPDGRLFAASIHKPNARWDGGTVYESISHLPWLTALAAWEVGTTYTRGLHFTAERTCALGDPDVGDAGPLLQRYGLAVNDAIQFRVERARGWIETEDTPPRAAGGPFDEHRTVTMRKARPGAPDTALEVTGSYAGFRVFPGAHTAASYTLVLEATPMPLVDVQWADWAADGELLVATTDGRLEIRALAPDGTQRVTFAVDLADERPDPTEPPAWAAHW